MRKNNFLFSKFQSKIWDISLHLHVPCSKQVGYDTRSIFKWSFTGLNSEFSFSLTSCQTKAKQPSLPYYLPIGGRRIIEFIPFPRVDVSSNSCIIASCCIIRVYICKPHNTNTQATLLFRYECFIINFRVWFFDTRRETILKSLS